MWSKELSMQVKQAILKGKFKYMVLAKIQADGNTAARHRSVTTRENARSCVRFGDTAGTWVTFGGQITDEMAEQLMTLAYDNGINLFDTAEVYAAGKAEVVLGNIIKKKGWRRSSLVITTKIFWGGKAETERGLSRKHIIEGTTCTPVISAKACNHLVYRLHNMRTLMLAIHKRGNSS
ncbi:unnamed protein product [Ranitomeya imitator]|uniref:NADP-dependent oxidoreductase domain-containing protein n=1 Tax=Ranitomeya imitator TaxID=111125 RepID=A0ABN9MMC3_9NEOB|nr:unnamed protein product [Ranitomeya imitator]